MISAYNSIITYDKGDWQSFLEQIGVDDVFNPLFKTFPESEQFPVVLRNNISIVIKYIVKTYSIESDMIVIGADWQKTKKKIFESVSGEPKRECYEALVLLKSDTVINLINRWLEYRDQDQFTQIQMLKDLQVEMRITSISPIKKASGELDYDQKFKNAQYSIDLKKMIKDSESELIQNSIQLKDAIKEFRETRQKSSFGLETFLKEEQNGNRA